MHADRASIATTLAEARALLLNAAGERVADCASDANRRALVSIVERQSAEIETLRVTLDKSISLQSHYAKLLNDYDGGSRLSFNSSAEWMQRLRMLAEKETP